MRQWAVTAAIAGDLLEDVALARAVKGSGRKLRFRYAADAVRTRMYRNFRQLREGWTKNLALLFPDPGRLAAKSLLLWGFAWGVFLWRMVTHIGVGLTGRIESRGWAHTFLLALAGVSRYWWWNPIGIGGILFLGQRLRRANFTWDLEVLGAMAGTHVRLSVVAVEARPREGKRIVERAQILFAAF